MQETGTILDTVRRIEDHQASMDRDMTKDRQDLQNLNIKVEAIASELAELRKAINLNAERTRDRVAEAVEPIINSTDQLTSQIKKSKKVYIAEPKNWFERFINKVVRG